MKRIHSIDTIRGLSVIGMIYYHLVYDLVYIFNQNSIEYLNSLKILQVLVGSTFIFIAGISSNFSRDNLRSGFKLLIIAYAITGVTTFLGDPVVFGVLHLLGFCTVIVSFTDKSRDTSFIKGIALVGLFIIFYYLDIKNIEILSRLREYNLYPLGLFGDGFSSSDYYPLIPWGFLYFGGKFIGGYLLKTGTLYERDFDIEVLSFIGKHSLLIYILHQPIILAILSAIYR